jgi:2-amino-4-hydroxy-6-hydroxymethyldihydropteridine diphosphokinase
MPKSTYIALGSNLGDQEENLCLAATELQKLSLSPLVASSIWWSKPEGFDEDVAEFCNAVVAAEVEMAAEELLVRLKEIEQQLGRTRGKSRGESGTYLSRTIDLDIIDYDLRVLKTKGLELPHPRAASRRFVLLPLQEVAPGYRFPGLEHSLEHDLEALIQMAPENTMRKSNRLNPLA